MSRNTSTSIDKLEKPYPLLQFQGRLYMQVGVLFVVTDTDSDETVAGKRVLGYNRSQETYPIIAQSIARIGSTVCTETFSCMGCNFVHEGETVYLEDLYAYFDNDFYDSLHRDNEDDIVYVPPFSPTSLALSFKKYGCTILPPKETIIEITLSINSHEYNKFYLETWGQKCFFCVPVQDVVTTAKEFLRIIKEYSDIVSKKLKFAFTCDGADSEPFLSLEERNNYIKELNEYIQANG